MSELAEVIVQQELLARANATQRDEECGAKDIIDAAVVDDPGPLERSRKAAQPAMQLWIHALRNVDGHRADIRSRRVVYSPTQGEGRRNLRRCSSSCAAVALARAPPQIARKPRTEEIAIQQRPVLPCENVPIP
jgi:hypothetical protein